MPARAQPRFLGSYRAISPIRSQVELVFPVCRPQLFTGIIGLSGFEPKRFLKRFDRKCICKKAKVSRRDPSRMKMLVWIVVLNIGTFLFIFFLR